VELKAEFANQNCNHPEEILMAEGLYSQGNTEVSDAAQAGADSNGAASSLYSDAYGVQQQGTASTTTDVAQASETSGTGFQGDPGIYVQNDFQGDPGIYAQNDFQGDPGIYANTDSSTAMEQSTATDGTLSDTTASSDAVSPATSDASQAATAALVRRLLDDPSFMFAMKTAGDYMSQQGFSTFLNFVQQDVAAYPTADDQSILLDAAQKGQAAGMDAADLSVLQGYIGQPEITAADTTGGDTTMGTNTTAALTGMVDSTTADTTAVNTTEATDVVPVG
jgi:hypothetical protein